MLSPSSGVRKDVCIPNLSHALDTRELCILMCIQVEQLMVLFPTATVNGNILICVICALKNR